MTEDVKDDLGKHVGTYFKELGYIDREKENTIYISKDETIYNINLIVKKGMEQDDDLIKEMKNAVVYISEIGLDGDEININLMNEKKEIIKTISDMM